MRSRGRHERDGDNPIGRYAIGGLGPVAVAGALVAVRDEIQQTTAVLVLVIVVVLAAIAGGRGAGALAAVMAAMSFDFFLTRPYLSLRITSEADIENALVLLVIGLLVGQVVAGARQRRSSEERATGDVACLVRIAERAAAAGPVDEFVDAVEAELTELLSLRECFFTPILGEELPTIDRSGALVTTEHWLSERGEPTLPVQGATVLVFGGGRTLGQLVLRPDFDAGAPLRSRVIAVALADHLGAVIAARGLPPDRAPSRRG